MPDAQATRVVGRRVGGALIDALLIAAVAVGLFFLLTEKLPKAGYANGLVLGDSRWAFTEDSKRVAWVAAVGAFALLVLVVAPAFTGRTPGKAAVGVRVVNAGGGRPGVGRTLLRTIAWIVDAFPYVLPGLVGVIAAVNSREHRRVGDVAAGTFVVGGAERAAGWYADPSGQARLRWWDGSAWTDQTSA